VIWTLAVLVAAALVQAQPAPVPPNDLDAFMQKVLARREVNRKTLNQYVLDEVETLDLLGPGNFPLRRMKREFTWYVREGMHVRSPVRFDGVTVSDEERDQYERRWMRHERERLARKENDEKEKTQAPVSTPATDQNVVSQLSEPRFVSEAYFMDFKFEPGNYYLAGRETLEGKPVLKIEYYPTKLFADEDEPAKGKDKDKRVEETKEQKHEREAEADIERKMNKTALVTLWVDPAEYQIVKYTFENVWMDFLPAGWIVKVDMIRASMTMGQPFAGVWLPRRIDAEGKITLANGSYDVTYARAFSDYREANVSIKVKIPKEHE
jgi:hypothetical protein